MQSQSVARDLSPVWKTTKRRRSTQDSDTVAHYDTARHSDDSILAIFKTLNAQCFHWHGLTPPSQETFTTAIDSGRCVRLVVDGIAQGPLLPEPLLMQPEIDSVFAKVFVHWPILDRRTFDHAFDTLSMTRIYGDSKIEWDHIALVNSVLALGAFVQETMSPSTSLPSSLQHSQQQREIYFIRAATLAPPMRCHRNIVTLHTSMCLSLYLLLSGSLKQCNEFMDHVCAAVLAFGLHTSEDASPDPNDKILRLRYRTYLSCQLLDANIALLVGAGRRLPALSKASEMVCSADCSLADAALKIEVDAVNLVHFEGVVRLHVEECYTSSATLDIMFMNSQSMESGLQAWYENHVPDSIRHTGLVPKAKRRTPHATLTQGELFFLSTYARLRMLIYYPYLRHILDAAGELSSSVFTCISHCTEAAADVVECASLLAQRGEVAACTAQVLTLATAVLLAAKTRDVVTATSNAAVNAPSSWYEAMMLLQGVAPGHDGVSGYLKAIRIPSQKLFGDMLVNKSPELKHRQGPASQQ